MLHRVIQVRENDYVILGDNCIRKEYGITDDDIIGVMTEYVRKGKKHTVNELGYRLYCHIWVDFVDARVILQKVRMKAGRFLKRKEKEKH